MIDQSKNERSPAGLIVIEPASETPIYQQIRNQIILTIAEGRLQEGSPLPATRQLGQDFGINFHTVNKAYDQLRQEGFVSLTRKQGSVVHIDQNPAQRTIEAWQERLRVILAEAVARGMPEDVILLECKKSLDSFSDR